VVKLRIEEAAGGKHEAYVTGVTLLNLIFVTSPSFSLIFYEMSRQDKSTTERNARTLRELVKLPENKVCADCKRNGASVAYWWYQIPDLYLVLRSSMGIMEYVNYAY